MTADKILLRALRGEALPRPPIWLMRQAGRYLPEYRAVRQEAGSFLDLCFSPALAAEVTLQPIRRYGFDAAILFSDILVVPHAMGQSVRFEEGVGPRLEPLKERRDIEALQVEGVVERLAPVMETLRLLRRDLPPEVTLIGFAGAPWTVASYMVEGGSSRDFALVKGWAFRDPEGFQALIDRLVEATVAYLDAQVAAGAEVIQLFDSWASALPAGILERWSLRPMRAIAQAIKARHPGIPVILFPRGVGVAYEDFARNGGAEGLSLDSGVPVTWAKEILSPHGTVQGNLDPILLVSGGEAMRAEARAICAALEGRPHIFNLGHGIVPQTPPDHVAELVSIVRGSEA